MSTVLPSVGPRGPQLEAGLVESRMKNKYTFLPIKEKVWVVIVSWFIDVMVTFTVHNAK